MKSSWQNQPLADFVTSRPGNNKIIKGKQSDQPGDGLVQGFSASGPDVWVTVADYNQPGVVISAVGARCGKTFPADGEWTAIANTHVLLPSKDIDPRWLWYRTNDEEFWIKGGAAQPFVKVKDTLQQPILVPPLAEQQRIVGVLDEAFAGLATAQAHAAQNLQNARALFESCLQVEIGDNVALGELVDIKTGKLDANAAVEDGEYPFFTCSRETYAIDTYAFDCEAVLLAGNNAVGDFNVKHFVGKFNAYQRTYVLTVNVQRRALCRYLYFQLQKNLAKFKSQSVGAGTKFLKLGMIKDMMIPLPSVPEQARIVTQLDALATETQRLTRLYENKLAALAALKKSLLHQAFSGEL